jgi:hypothetical protein
MSGVLDQQAQGKKPGRAKGDHGTKKLAAVGADTTATTDAIREASKAVKKLEQWSDKNNKGGEGQFKTSWSLTVSVTGGKGGKRVKRSVGTEGVEGGSAALPEPTTEVVAACFGCTTPAEVAQVWTHVAASEASTGHYNATRNAPPTRFTRILCTEDAVRYFDGEKRIKPSFASLVQKDAAAERDLGQVGAFTSQPSTSGPES